MDLYCGAGGMTAGLTMAGIEATHGVESDAQVREREGGPKPMHSCGNTAVEAEVGPTSGPTWFLSHLAVRVRGHRAELGVGGFDSGDQRGVAGVDAHLLDGGPRLDREAGDLERERC